MLKWCGQSTPNMRTICSGKYAVAVEAARNLQVASDLAIIRAEKHNKALLFLAGLHRYELLKNRQPSGEFREMEGALGKAMNEGLRQKFIDEVRAGNMDAVELAWVVRERNIRPTQKESELIDEIRDGKRAASNALHEARSKRFARMQHKINSRAIP